MIVVEERNPWNKGNRPGFCISFTKTTAIFSDTGCHYKSRRTLQKKKTWTLR